MREGRRRRWLAWVAVLPPLAAAAVLRDRLGIEWSTDAIRELVTDSGYWGPLVFVLVTTFRGFLFVPSQILLLAAGVCFGPVLGTLYGAAGIVASGSLAYGFTRWAARDLVLDRLPPALRSVLDAADSRRCGLLLFLGTAYPLGPLTAYHGGAALTGIGVPGFLAALGLGSLVRAATYTSLGGALAEGDARAMLAAAAVLLLLAAAPMAHPRTRAWLRARVSGG